MSFLKRVKRFNQKLCYGCSYVPDFYFAHCCINHDDDYEKGGTEEDRKKADIELRDCIIESGSPRKAKLYYIGARIFGRFFFKYKKI